MTAGQTYSVSITMKNTGTTSWTAAGAYKLGSQNPQDNGTWTGNNRVLLSAGESIAPGQSKTFTFNVTAPSINGTYNFQWKMVQEWVQWFGDSTPNIAVAVTSDSSCTDDCTPSGAKQCSGTTGYQTCGNYDTDTCLEWSSAMACAAGQTCSGGTCGSSAANYRIPVSVGNTGSVLSDYQVKITVPYNSHMKPSFDDIRFTASDGTNLSYWRESYTASAAIFWVKINSIPAGSSTIYLKYGDASASTASNGADTFVLYDDFNSGSVSDWTLSSSCGTGARVANSSVYHSSPYSLQNYFTGRCGAGYSYSSRSFTAPVNGTYAVDFYAKSMGCSGCTVSARLFFDNSQLFTQSISGALQAGTVASSLTAGTHTVKVGMYTTNAFSGTFQAYFDDIHVRKTASPAPTYSLGSEQLAMDDGAGLSQVAGASTVSYAELQAKISQIQQSILLLIEQMRVMLSTRL
jgi:hypothetical protein